MGPIAVVWLIGLWLVQVAWVQQGAVARGRSPMAWGLAALIWGPVAILGIIAAGPKAEDPAEARDVSAMEEAGHLVAESAERARRWLKSA